MFKRSDAHMDRYYTLNFSSYEALRRSFFCDICPYIMLISYYYFEYDVDFSLLPDDIIALFFVFFIENARTRKDCVETESACQIKDFKKNLQKNRS